MKGATPAFFALGRRLLAHEAGESASSADLAAAAEAVLKKLRARMALYFAEEGFSRLLARTLRLAKREHHLLATVEAEPPTNNPAAGRQLRGLRESAAAGEPAEVLQAVAAVLGGLIWLLTRFMGWDITRRELRRAWPALAFPEAVPGAEEAEQ